MKKRNPKNTYIVNRMSLSNIRAPQLILFGKPGLKSVCWVFFADITSAAAPVTSMDADDFAERLFDFWDEWLLRW